MTRKYCAIIGVGDFTFAELGADNGGVMFVPWFPRNMIAAEGADVIHSDAFHAG